MSSGNTGNDPSGAGGGNLSMRLLSRGMLAGAGGGPTGDETYLEAFVESLSTLPHELRRNMDLMKDLDASCRCVVNNKQKKNNILATARLVPLLPELHTLSFAILRTTIIIDIAAPVPPVSASCRGSTSAPPRRR